MKKMKLTTAIIAMVLIPCLFACKSNKPSESTEEQPTQEEITFQQVATEFLEAFDNKNNTNIATYVDAETGFFVLDNPGAATIPYYFSSWEQITSMQGEYDVAYLNKMKTNCKEIKEGNEPEYSCETDSWSQQGCFFGKSNKLHIEKLYKQLLEFGFIDKEKYDAEIAKAKLVDNYDLNFVYCTNESVGFYFTFKNNKWILVCIDKVTPCSA